MFHLYTLAIPDWIVSFIEVTHNGYWILRDDPYKEGFRSVRLIRALPVFYPVSQGSIFQMSIWLANLLLISANASESFKRLSGEDNTFIMWSIFFTLALAWFSLEIWCPFRLMRALSENILDLSWTALALFTF